MKLSTFFEKKIRMIIQKKKIKPGKTIEFQMSSFNFIQKSKLPLYLFYFLCSLYKLRLLTTLASSFYLLYLVKNLNKILKYTTQTFKFHLKTQLF